MAEDVPGMAEYIERRRLEVGLSPTAFAEAAGVTAQGLAPVRKGRRRRYQDSVIIGVANALRVERDWYERLLRGEEPAKVVSGTANANLGLTALAEGTVTPGVERRLAALEQKVAEHDEALRSLAESAPPVLRLASIDGQADPDPGEERPLEPDPEDDVPP